MYRSLTVYYTLANMCRLTNSFLFTRTNTYRWPAVYHKLPHAYCLLYTNTII